MYISNISLNNYRNYSSLNMDLSEDVNIIIGENARGKTNILESIYLAATSKSNRLSSDKEIIKIGEDSAIINISYVRDDLSHRTIIKLNRNSKKEIAIDGEIKKKISDLLGNIFLVFFSPDDLSLVKGGPIERRRFLDIEICQIDKVYLKNLANYYKVLKERNLILKNRENLNYSLLDVYDEQLVNYGIKIISKREEFIKSLNSYYKDLHYKISGKKEKSKIKYKKNVKESKFLEELRRNRLKDIEKRNTSVGPHKDDFNFILNEINLRNYGSRGQVRTAVLALKLAEIEIIKNLVKISPILLLDDVLSELDENRQVFLIDQLKDIQTIITGTGVEDFIIKKLGHCSIFRTKNNEIEKIK